MGKKWLNRDPAVAFAKRSAGVALALGLAVGGLAVGPNARANTSTTSTAAFDDLISGHDNVWTMPSEVKGTYCVDFSNSMTPLGNHANGNFTYTVPYGCMVCPNSTLTLNLGCAGIATTGCEAKFYLEDENGTKVAEATAPVCNNEINQLQFKFSKSINDPSDPNTINGPVTLHLVDDNGNSPTICFTNQCTTSDFYFSDGTLPSGAPQACMDTDKVMFAQRIQQFHINNDGGPRKDIIALDGTCPRSHFAGDPENVPDSELQGTDVAYLDGYDYECCDNDAFNSTDYIKVCDNSLDDPIDKTKYSLDLTLTSTNPDNLNAIDNVTLDGTPFSRVGSSYVLNKVNIPENECFENPLNIRIADKCPGTLLEDGDFVLNADFSFDPTYLNGLQDQYNLCYANATIDVPSTTLLTHHWVLDGWEGTVPYLSTYSGYKTFVKIFNDSAKPADVYVDVFPDNGNPIYNVKIGTVGAKKVGLFWASDIANAAGLSGDVTFAARFVVNAMPAFVHGVVIQKGAEGDRVIPIDKAASYKGQIPQFAPAGKAPSAE